MIIEWLEQNPIKPTVVGLSDDQILGLEKYLNSEREQNTFRDAIRDWLKTQTFTQSRVFTDSEIQQKYIELYDDYQSLLIDKQQFQPNWDDAPDNAVFCDVIFRFFDDYAKPVHEEPLLMTVARPKPPAPVIEAGQVWKSNYSVEILGVDTVIRYRHENDVCCTAEGIEDFLARFERVGGE